MSVRTCTLATVSATTTLTGFYTVPAGKTAIVKQLAVAKFATGAVVLTCTVLHGATAYGLLRESIPLAATVTNHDVYWVLEPGDVLRFQTDTGTATAWVSGVELAGVAP